MATPQEQLMAMLGGQQQAAVPPSGVAPPQGPPPGMMTQSGVPPGAVSVMQQPMYPGSVPSQTYPAMPQGGYMAPPQVAPAPAQAGPGSGAAMLAALLKGKQDVAPAPGSGAAALTALLAPKGSPQPLEPVPASMVRLSLEGLSSGGHIGMSEAKQLCRVFGDVEDIQTVQNGAVRVRFVTKEQAVEAVNGLNGKEFPVGEQKARLVATIPTTHEATAPALNKNGKTNEPWTLAKFSLSKHFFCGETSGFNALSRLLGTNNQHIRHIMNETGNAIDVHLQGIPSAEASDDTRLCLYIASQNQDMAQKAVNLIKDLMDTVSQQLKEHQRRRNQSLEGIALYKFSFTDSDGRVLGA